jgi:hypothetical protein
LAPSVSPVGRKECSLIPSAGGGVGEARQANDNYFLFAFHMATTEFSRMAFKFLPGNYRYFLYDKVLGYCSLREVLFI